LKRSSNLYERMISIKLDHRCVKRPRRKIQSGLIDSELELLLLDL